MSQANEAYEAWRDAELLARSVETRLQHCWESHQRHGSRAPTAGLMADVSKARTNANEKLTVAMMLMSKASNPAQ